MKTSSFKRFRDIGFAFTIIAVLIVLQTVRLQFSPDSPDVKDSVKAQHEQVVLPPQPERGLIYDRWGNLLAGNREVFDLEVSLAALYYPEKSAELFLEVDGKKGHEKGFDGLPVIL